jgi:hypothetical protein
LTKLRRVHHRPARATRSRCSLEVAAANGANGVVGAAGDAQQDSPEVVAEMKSKLARMQDDLGESSYIQNVIIVVIVSCLDGMFLAPPWLSRHPHAQRVAPPVALNAPPRDDSSSPARPIGGLFFRTDLHRRSPVNTISRHQSSDVRVCLVVAVGHWV